MSQLFEFTAGDKIEYSGPEGVASPLANGSFVFRHVSRSGALTIESATGYSYRLPPNHPSNDPDYWTEADNA